MNRDIGDLLKSDDSLILPGRMKREEGTFLEDSKQFHDTMRSADIWVVWNSSASRGAEFECRSPEPSHKPLFVVKEEGVESS